MTIKEFIKKLQETTLFSWRLNEREIEENYNFYVKLGYTHEQSLLLSICNFDDNNQAISSMLMKADKLRDNKLIKKPYCELIIENLDTLLADYKKEEPKTDIDYSTTHIGNTTGPAKGIFGGLSNLFSSRGKGGYSSVNYSISTPTKTTKSMKAAYSPELLPMDASVQYSAIDNSIAANAVPMMEVRKVSREAGSAAWNESFASNKIPNMADTETFQNIEEKGFQDVANNPTSSFRTTCNTAAMGTLLNHIRHGRAVKPSSVRMEELMNYFNYDLKGNDELLNINVEMCDKPYSQNKLLFIGVRGKVITPEKQNIVVLLDVSGSMYSNAHNMLKTIAAIVKKLNKGDTFSLVTYSSVDHTIIDSLTIEDNIDDIIKKMFEIHIDGCTNGSAGIETAYKIAANNYVEDGANKVILITDGDLNFGINSNDGLKNLILEKKKTGVFLSVIGMGIGNYKDDKLETLAKNGNGNYCVINDEFEVEDNIVKKYEQLIFSIAKDVKAQVEFNPAFIKSYRLLGYENREISHSDFNNDAVIAEPFGSGATCVALYEVELVDGVAPTSDLKYQKPVLTDSKEYCTVSVRYKLPLEDKSALISKSLDHIGEMTTNLKLAYICYAIAEKFRESDMADLKDELFARYLAETMKDDEIEKLNGNKMELLKFLAK